MPKAKTVLKRKSYVGQCFSCYYHDCGTVPVEFVSAAGIQTRTPVDDPAVPININDYPYKTSVIRYKDTSDGRLYDWAVSSLPTDDEEHLRAFLEKWVPWAVFVSCATNTD